MAIDAQEQKLMEELLFSGKKKPSFAKMLYLGSFDSSRIFPFPQVDPEEKIKVDEYTQKLQQFVDTHIDPEWIDKHAEIPMEVIKGLGSIGLLGLTIPKKYGGQEFSQYGYCKAMEIIARRCGSTALFINAHQSIGLKALLLYGTEEQRKKWLPGLARGELIAAFSLTEPNAGSDANGIETRAVYDPSKNVYRISGKKQWTTNGSMADVLTVMARTEIETPEGKQDKITAFLVTPNMPGFIVRDAALEKVGMRGTKTANLTFENMEVPEANILGPLGGGLKVCLTVLDFGRTTFGATCTGAAKELLERAISHAINRYQFKRPLASFSLVKQKIANMAALVYAMEATTYLTAGLVDRDEEDFMLESAMLKVFTSDSLWSILYDTMQIFGGRSFFTDQPFERMMRDARLNMIGEGSNEVMRAFIGLVGMRDIGIQLKGIEEAIKHPFSNKTLLWKFGKQFINRISGPEVPVQSDLLKIEAVQLSKAIRRFGISIIKLLSHYREDLFEQQLALDRIATSAIALYTISAVLSKLDNELTYEKNKENSLENDIAAAKLYCYNAFKTIDRSLDNIIDDHDAEIAALSDKITKFKTAAAKH